MSTRLVKDKIYDICVPQLKLAYIINTTNTLHKKFDVKYMCWGNQELELQEWEDLIYDLKTRILAVITFVPCKNTSR